MYKEKRTSLIFEVSSMHDTSITLIEKVMDGTPTEQTVDYDAFKVAFSESKGKMQSRFDEPSIASLHISEHACVQKDVERATIYLELSKLISTHGCFELGAIEFYFNPIEVKVKQAGIKKGDLKLIPGTDL